MTLSSSTAAKSLVQVTTETPVQTKAEAAQGDHQTVRKLAAEQAIQSNQQPPTS